MECGSDVLTALDAIRKNAREAHARQQYLIAERLYRTLLNEEANVDDAINLGALLRHQGRIKEGSHFYQKWVNSFGHDERFLLNACNCWNDNNEAHLALHYLEELHQKGLITRPLKLCLSDALNRLHRFKDCIELLQQCLCGDLNDKEIWVRIGLAHSKNQALIDALKAFNEAQRIDPNDLEMVANRITILKDLGHFDQAEELITQLSDAQQLQADVAQATAGLLMAQNKLVEATVLFQSVCKLRPSIAGYWLNWAAALRGLRRTVAPYHVLQQGLCYSPENEDLQEALQQILAEMARPEAAERCRTLWSRHGEGLKASYLFSRQFLGIGTAGGDSQVLADQARAWEQQSQGQSLGPLWPDTILEPLERRKLRVGYLSADLANHPVGRFLLPVLSNHDREHVEIWALSCGSHDDWITDHIRDKVDHWVDLRFGTTAQCARIVADLRLDVLVELGGFTGNSRLELLCYKPAPVQLSYLGYPGPTYLKCIDGWLGDSVLFEKLNPVDRTAHPLVELKGGYMVFDSGGELPKPKRTGGKHLRFGSFNHARKLTKATIDLFCRVMAANPEAELVLKSISFCEVAEQQRIRRRFEEAGLSGERLILLDWVEGGINHLQLYSEIDVALDPIPYGGATTTAEALWMGVPVVALAGDGMVGRLAASLLIHAGKADWVSRDLDGYVAIASALAHEGIRDSDKRLSLRDELQDSELADGKRLSHELEMNYWRLRTKVTPC